jgi:hypothetical protein
MRNKRVVRRNSGVGGKSSKGTLFAQANKVRTSQVQGVNEVRTDNSGGPEREIKSTLPTTKSTIYLVASSPSAGSSVNLMTTPLLANISTHCWRHR